MLRRGWITVFGATLLLLVGLAAGAQQAAKPVIQSFTPAQGSQCDTVSLVITGANFAHAEKVEFEPRTGIQVGSLTSTASATFTPGTPGGVAQSHTIQVQIKIDANAPPGPRAVKVVGGGMTATAKTRFKVVLAERPVVSTVTPNEVARDQTVELKIGGKHFCPGAQLSFSGGTGNWIAEMRSEVISPSMIRVKIHPTPTASLGARDITVENPNGLGGTGKGLLKIVARPAKP